MIDHLYISIAKNCKGTKVNCAAEHGTSSLITTKGNHTRAFTPVNSKYIYTNGVSGGTH